MKSDSKSTTAIVLETWRSLKDNTFAVKLRVTFNRKQKFYVLKEKNKKRLSMSKDFFEEVMDKDSTRNKKKLRLHLTELQQRAEDVIKDLPVFTFEAFEIKYFNKKTDQTDLFSSMEARAKELREEGRISTAVTFECALNSLKEFHKKESLPFEHITVKFLEKYENWMLTGTGDRRANSPTTVGMYLRNVRAMYRKAMKEGIIKDVLYPFGKDEYVIPGSPNVKKALTHAEVGKIINYDAVPGSPEQMYRDFWIFSYLCNGINVKDMAQIKYKNIDGDVIRLIREKTKRETRKKPKYITIIITRQLGRIIDTWANKPGLPDTYLLPILESGMTPEQKYRRVQDVTKLINRYINRIAVKLEIPKKVTSYTARHTFATVLKRSGASTEFISESLGHLSLETTEDYLDNFEEGEQRKWADKLTEGIKYDK